MKNTVRNCQVEGHNFEKRTYGMACKFCGAPLSGTSNYNPPLTDYQRGYRDGYQAAIKNERKGKGE